MQGWRWLALGALLCAEPASAPTSGMDFTDVVIHVARRSDGGDLTHQGYPMANFIDLNTATSWNVLESDAASWETAAQIDFTFPNEFELVEMQIQYGGGLRGESTVGASNVANVPRNVRVEATGWNVTYRNLADIPDRVDVIELGMHISSMSLYLWGLYSDDCARTSKDASRSSSAF